MHPYLTSLCLSLEVHSFFVWEKQPNPIREMFKRYCCLFHSKVEIKHKTTTKLPRLLPEVIWGESIFL